MNAKSKYDLPPRVASELAKRGWSEDIYGPLFNKCLSSQELKEDEYQMGKHLAEIGFMSFTTTPIWRGDSYCGNRITFLSHIPILGTHP